MIKYSYDSDIASLKLISKKDKKSFFCLSNGCDGSHYAYIFDNDNEFNNFVKDNEKYLNFDYVPITLENGWVIKNYDCEDGINENDFELNSDFIKVYMFSSPYIYRDFAFVLNKDNSDGQD